MALLRADGGHLESMGNPVRIRLEAGKLWWGSGLESSSLFFGGDRTGEISETSLRP